MTPEVASIVVAFLGLVGTTAAAYLAAGARSQAREARRDVKPVADGFADEVRERLGEILVVATDARDVATEARDEAAKAHDKIDEHLAAHANAHVLQFPPAREARG